MIVALDSRSGTPLWRFVAPRLNEGLNMGPKANDFDPQDKELSEPLWSRFWVIGSDGARCGVTTVGADKIK